MGHTMCVPHYRSHSKQNWINDFFRYEYLFCVAFHVNVRVKWWIKM